MFTASWTTFQKPLAGRCVGALPKAASTAAAADDTETVLGCGWFDSSHDLHAGLCVQEHVQSDTVVQHLPLAEWLEVQLSGWRFNPAS